MASAVIVTHKGGRLLERCVVALQNQTPAPQQIVVVVSAAERLTVPAGTEALQLGKNVGFARAANAGLARFPDRDAVLLNDDTEAQPGFWEALTAARARLGPGIYQPRIELASHPGQRGNPPPGYSTEVGSNKWRSDYWTMASTARMQDSSYQNLNETTAESSSLVRKVKMGTCHIR
jgi:hypothetical protein